MKKFLFTAILTAMLNGFVFAQEKIMLYPSGVSESNELTVEETWRDKDFLLNISEPRMVAYPASKDNNC